MLQVPRTHRTSKLQGTARSIHGSAAFQRREELLVQVGLRLVAAGHVDHAAGQLDAVLGTETRPRTDL